MTRNPQKIFVEVTASNRKDVRKRGNHTNLVLSPSLKCSIGDRDEEEKEVDEERKSEVGKKEK